MKTDALIAALASDRIAGVPPARLLRRAVLPAVVVAAILFLVLAGPRADLATVAAGSLRFTLKLLLTGGVLVGAAGLLLRLARPGSLPGFWRGWLVAVPLVLLFAVVVELVALPRGQWQAAAIGQNARWCLVMIPLLGLAPLAGGLWALRQAAPLRPMLTGSIVGLLSAGIAGFLYALHCTDDSPLFVAIWYSTATAILALAGALLGRWLLRW
ncbi:MAG: hypothetical protein RL030_858 [Pseudomonadota bacterium]|jgi:hypothetical protein